MVTRGGSGSTASQQIGGVWEDDNKIVVGIDIRTTQSEVALAYLEKGEKREIHRISQWPGQGVQDWGAKIPTAIWCNLETKKAGLFGAEAMSREGRELGEDIKWFLVKHFKLHLQPKDLRKSDMKLDPLPPEITLAQIYSDFLGYLLKHTKAFVEKRMAHGKKNWQKYKPTLELVIAHPNGWGGPEQHFLRKAAIDCGFANEENASRQVQFLTEAEASVHFCIHHSNLSNKLEVGTNIAVCDAGGSTVDTTLYSVISTTPVLQLREVRMSDSIQAGGILVNIKFEEAIRKAMNNFDLPPADAEGLATAGVEDFENYAKRNFGSSDEPISGSEVVSIRVANTGSYGASSGPLKIHRGSLKVPSSKAVADGSVIWNILCSVFSRTPRRSFGTICATTWLPWMPEAEGRAAYINPQGIPVIPGKWVEIVKKGNPVDIEETFREKFNHSVFESNPVSLSLSVDIFGYSGDDDPMWAMCPHGFVYPSFEKMWTITAQLWDLEGALKKETGLNGIEYWEFTVEFCLRFGTTELEAHLEWGQNGVKRKGRPTVVPGRPIDL